MKKFNLIVLAGGQQKPLEDVTGIANKAQIPIHGKPMLEWVLDAFESTGRIAETVVAGPRELESLSCMQHVRKRVHGGPTVLASLMNAVGYVKMRLLPSETVHRGYLVSFGDAVFLNKNTIDAVLKNIDETQPGLALHYVEKGTYERAGLPLTRTFIPLGDGLYTGTTIYYVRRFRDLAGIFVQLAKLRKTRKDPDRMLDIIGCKGLSIPEVEAQLSKAADANVRIFVLDLPEAGMDVDKPVDLELARARLSPPEPETSA
jgi:GTP:adenosylcobinamide-phosphate guanylyltransferase